MNSRIPAIAAALVLFLILPVAGLGIAVLAAVGGAVAGGCSGDGGPGGGSQQIGNQVWSAEQTSNAHTIVALAAARGLPKRAAVIAVSTAIVESRLENPGHGDGYGDKDSLGLFQQRPSQGWGSPAEILHPRTATAAFYDRLVTIPRWQTLQPGVAADTVQNDTAQNSAHPERYGTQEAAAAALVDRFWPGPDTPGPEAGPGVVPPVCPDDGESNIAPSGPIDRSALPPGFALPADPAQEKAVAFALGAVGMPYVFGAKGPDAYDCSGLTQAAWAAAGVGVSAGTLTQIHDGVPVSRLADLAPGDLLFTPGSLGTPSNPRHVGIYVGHGLLVDAHSSKVGVILERLDTWRDKIVAIRRVGGPGLAAGPLRGFPAPAAAAAAP
jgi:cell wall-associated NlpC family hydrolase